MKDLLKADDKYVYINTDSAEAYIPESIVGDITKSESCVCYEYGDAFRTIGIFPIIFYDDDSEDKGITKTLIYPNIIETHPSSTSTVTKTVGGIEDKYRVLHFNKGDVLMEVQTKKSPDNCEMFMRLITSGKIPKALSYTEIFDAWMTNFAINDLKPDVPPVVLQAIIATMCRDANDTSKEFRMIAGKDPNYDPNGYTTLNMNEISASSSVMSSLSFERYGEKLATSIIMTKEGTKQKISPIEKVITM